MGSNQYHEPAGELSAPTRTLARMCANLTEEAQAIGWYMQRISVEPDVAARAVMTDSLGEEYKHFSMELEFLLQHTPLWRAIAHGILFRDGDIVANGRAAEESGTAPPDESAEARIASLGIGSLKGALP